MTRLALLGCDDGYVSAVERFGSVEIIVDETDPPSIDGALDERIEEVDAVVVGPDCESRSAVARRSALAGKHVLVADAFADTLDETEDLVSVCSERGVTLMLGSERLYAPAVQTVKESIDSGKLGALGALRIHCWLSGEDDAAVGPGGRSGALVEQIAIARWLFGSAPTEIFSLRRARGGAETVSVHFGFADGGMALIDVTLSPPDMQGYYTLSAIGSTGAAYADEHRDAHLVFGEGAPLAFLPEQDRARRINEVGEFLAALREQRAPTTGGEWLTAALEVTKAVLDGIASGAALRWEGAGYEPV